MSVAWRAGSDGTGLPHGNRWWSGPGSSNSSTNQPRCVARIAPSSSLIGITRPVPLAVLARPTVRAYGHGLVVIDFFDPLPPRDLNSTVCVSPIAGQQTRARNPAKSPLSRKNRGTRSQPPNQAISSLQRSPSSQLSPNGSGIGAYHDCSNRNSPRRGLFLSEATQPLRGSARSIWLDLAKAMKLRGPQTAIEVNWLPCEVLPRWTEST